MSDDIATWKPRCSSLGYYMQCDRRAALDRLVAMGKLPAVPDTPSKYADFGTCVHWYMQAAMRCKFPSGDPIKHKYTEEQFKNATNMFDGDAEKTTRMVHAVAQLAIAHMPKNDSGWHAEFEFDTPLIPGHIDFLSTDLDDVVDLKTTSRKPPRNRMKAEHLYQQIGYALGVLFRFGRLPKRIRILYASSTANWAILSQPFFPTTPENEAFIYGVAQEIWRLHEVTLDNTIPKLGNHCFDCWCPHTGLCRDQHWPGPADSTDVADTPQPTVQELF